MKRPWIRWGAVLAAAAVAGALLLRGSEAAPSSTLSASAQGWLAARAYLDRRGSRVTVVDRPLDAGAKGEPRGGGALVLAFPWQAFPSRDELDALRQRLAAGGTIVYAYSGQRRSLGEEQVARTLGLSLETVREDPPLSPLSWYRFVRAEARLAAEPGSGPVGGAEIVIRAPDGMPTAPKDAKAVVSFRGGGKDLPAVFTYPRARGRVVVVPADALSNARLGHRGNADLLESLRVAVGEPIAFDEYHHGLVASEILAASGGAPSLDLLLAQLAALYLIVAWSLGRRFGPAWEEPPEIASSTTAFLTGLGALHRKLRHSAPASVRLIHDAETLDPRLQAPASLRDVAVDAGDAAFLDVARAVARLQRRGRS